DPYALADLATFRGILGRLRALVAPHAAPTRPDAPSITPAQRNFLCEVAADLKGKYASALMGATASIVAEGTWSGVDVEPVLFPEKGEELRRNADLARAMRRTLDAIGELQDAVPFAELLERWRGGARVDPYALADFATFRGIFGRLLKRDLRRGFYSGDYHQIQRRELALSARMAALEALHQRTWSEPAGAEGIAAGYGEMERLTLEIAAILDVELLEKLLGARAVKDLRIAAAAEGVAGEVMRGGRKKLAPTLEPLVPLLAGEDLKTFLSLLLGSVLKRASLASTQRTGRAPVAASATPPRRAPAADTAPTPVMARPVLESLRASDNAPPSEYSALPSIDDALPSLDEPLFSIAEIAELSPAVAAAAPEPPPWTAASAAPRAAAARKSDATPPSGELARRRETLEQLLAILQSLQSGENPHWSSFRMLQRLLDRHARIPPSIVQGAHPFVYEVLNGLVPQLEVAASFGAVPQEARRRLVECCTALTDDSLSPAQMVEEVPAHLARLHRLLEALQAATAAQLRALPAG
ncbi:MAG TPA: hypothetical protein VN923_13640, partial [Thermoanaerobaculia bacterium]|nr:hypothetical protein [Thermoanaerobaculia bacterium]